MSTTLLYPLSVPPPPKKTLPPAEVAARLYRACDRVAVDHRGDQSSAHPPPPAAVTTRRAIVRNMVKKKCFFVDWIFIDMFPSIKKNERRSTYDNFGRIRHLHCFYM